MRTAEGRYHYTYMNGRRVLVRCHDKREWCCSCGIALDVGGGCSQCKPYKGSR